MKKRDETYWEKGDYSGALCTVYGHTTTREVGSVEAKVEGVLASNYPGWLGRLSLVALPLA